MSFKLSRDPHFVDKPRDGVGLYLNPPEHARVLLAGREEPDSSPRCKAGVRNTQWSAGRPRSTPTPAQPRLPVSAALGRDDPAELLPREGNAGGKARPNAGQFPQLLRREGLPKTLVDLSPRDPPCAPASLAIPQQAKLAFEALDGFARFRQFAPQQEDPLLPKPCLASLEAFDFSVHHRPSWPLPHHPWLFAAARLGESSVQRLRVCREAGRLGTAARLRRRVAALGPRDVVRVFRMRCAGRLPPTLARPYAARWA